MVKKKSRNITVENVKGSLGFLLLTMIGVSILVSSAITLSFLESLLATFTTIFGCVVMGLMTMFSFITSIVCFMYSLNRIFGEELWNL